jgi:hypothetical protein
MTITKEKKKQYLPFEEVSYVNNISLPRKVLNETAVFNYPKRSGEKNVTSFFNVKTLEDIKYKAGGFEINSFSTQELSGYLKTIRPYILVYRLQKLKTENDIKDAIRIVKSINIKLCSELTHTYNEVINEAEQYDLLKPSLNCNNPLIQIDMKQYQKEYYKEKYQDYHKKRYNEKKDEYKQRNNNRYKLFKTLLENHKNNNNIE